MRWQNPWSLEGYLNRVNDWFSNIISTVSPGPHALFCLIMISMIEGIVNNSDGRATWWRTESKLWPWNRYPSQVGRRRFRRCCFISMRLIQHTLHRGAHLQVNLQIALHVQDRSAALQKCDRMNDGYVYHHKSVLRRDIKQDPILQQKSRLITHGKQ